MDTGQFAKAYVAQKQVDYSLAGNDYDTPEALDYMECTAVEYNDIYVSLSEYFTFARDMFDIRCYMVYCNYVFTLFLSPISYET